MKRSNKYWLVTGFRLIHFMVTLTLLISNAACNLTGPVGEQMPLQPTPGINFQSEEVEPENVQQTNHLQVVPQAENSSVKVSTNLPQSMPRDSQTPAQPRYPIQQTAAWETIPDEKSNINQVVPNNSVLESTKALPQSLPAEVGQRPYYTGLQPKASQPTPAVNPNLNSMPPVMGALPPCYQQGCQFCGPAGGCRNCLPQNFTYPYQMPPCWPEDEYIFDGGDQNTKTVIDSEFGVHGLDIEDTIGHYDTLDGRREVTPSNRVCVYAPRFAAVRKVYGLNQNEGQDLISGIHADLRIQSQERNQLANNVNQPLELDQHVGTKMPNIFRERLLSSGLENRVSLVEFEEEFKPYENFAAIRMGKFLAAEKASLAKSINNALAWTENVSAQVVIEGQQAYEAVHNNTALETYHYHMPKGKPRLRVIKTASKSDALPGEIVEFTLRFDNVGDQKIGNVTIIDNLTPRLELVEDSAQCDVEATFLTQENELGSLVLRWEIIDPLKVGEGGIIRFKAQVR